MKLWRSAIRLWRSASSRACARSGSTWSPSIAGSATALIEHLLDAGEHAATACEQHEQVVDQVGSLLLDTLIGLFASRARELLGLLHDLLPDALRIGEQLGRVGAAGSRAGALCDRALEHRQNLMRSGRLQLAAVKAGAFARVAGRAGGVHERQQRVAVAVKSQLPDALRVAARGALVPLLLARAAEEVQFPRGARARECLLVHVGERENLAGAPVLHHTGHEPVLVVCDLRIDGLLLRARAHSHDCRSSPSSISGSGASPLTPTGHCWNGCRCSVVASRGACSPRAARFSTSPRLHRGPKSSSAWSRFGS